MQPSFTHPLAFVPTMGALHAGHESLIALAKSICDEVLVSIFVNPLQFESQSDLAKYPRSLESDIWRATTAGATQVWSPTIAEIYSEPPTLVSAGVVGTRFEGNARLGHFDGMLTVVKRLFEVVEPSWAVFGEKDFQQLFLVKQMVSELDLPITIVSAPIVRAVDGLALSSRNLQLGEAGRQNALVISRALTAATQERSISNAKLVLQQILASEPRFTTDYAEIIDESNFEVAKFEGSTNRALVAGWVNGVRLLDNMMMKSSEVAI
jgi:pantoate--beta-alanine ligase